MLGFLVLLTAVAYWPVRHFGFVNFDDGLYVYNNAHVHAGFSSASLRYAFTSFDVGNWNPLIWISFFIDQTAFHLRPGAMHVENVLLHLIGGLLLWRLLFLATGSLNRSFIVAALFLIHPMHVESVAWISERKDVLSTPLLLAAMLMYVHYCRHSRGVIRWWFYFGTLVFFGLSLMAKSMGVTLPAVLLLMDFWPLGRWPARSWISLLLEKIPLLAMSVAMAVVGSIAQVKTGATTSLEMLGWTDRFANAVVSYFTYMYKLLVPRNFSVFYPHPGSRPFAAAIAACGILSVFTFFFGRLWRKYPFAIVGWLWFVGTLVPVIGLVQIGSQALADRYSYFPSIGFFILIVWSLGEMLGHVFRGRRGFIAAMPGVVVLLLAGLAVIARKQVGYWYDTETLFSHALEATGGENRLADVVLANIAFDRGDVHKAVDFCNHALRNGPYSHAEYALGHFWINDDPHLAASHFRIAVQLAPDDADNRIGLARALHAMGHLDEARSQAQAAVDAHPDNTDAREELNLILADLAKKPLLNNR